MSIRTYTQQERVCANSRLTLPYEVTSSMNTWNKLANNCNARVTFVPGVERPIGPFGNWIQTITITIEGDYDNPKCKELFDSLQNNSTDRLKKLLAGDFSNISENSSSDTADFSYSEGNKKQTSSSRRTIAVTGSNTNALLKRAFLFLEDGDWNSANDYCEAVLDINPECAEAYLGKLMADLQVHKIKDIANCNDPIEDNTNFQKVLRFGNEKIKSGLQAYSKRILERLENEHLEETYQKACSEMNASLSEEGQRSAAKMFTSIVPYKDSEEKRKLCLERADLYQKELARKEEEARREAEEKHRRIKCFLAIVIPSVLLILAVIFIFTNVVKPTMSYNAANDMLVQGKYAEAISAFEALGDFKDSKDRVQEAIAESIAAAEAEENARIEEQKARAYETAIKYLESKDYDKAISGFTELGDYKDSLGMLQEAKYQKGVVLISNGNYDAGYAILSGMSDYKDSYEIMANSKYTRAKEFMVDQSYEQAKQLLDSIPDYKDVASLLEDFHYRIVSVTGYYNSKYNFSYKFDESGNLTTVSVTYRTSNYNLEGSDGYSCDAVFTIENNRPVASVDHENKGFFENEYIVAATNEPKIINGTYDYENDRLFINKSGYKTRTGERIQYNTTVCETVTLNNGSVQISKIDGEEEYCIINQYGQYERHYKDSTIDYEWELVYDKNHLDGLDYLYIYLSL